MPEVRRSVTETLVAVMEEFSASEPKECIVIYTNEAGELCWSSTSDSMVTKLGLVECCRQYLIAKMRAE